MPQKFLSDVLEMHVNLWASAQSEFIGRFGTTHIILQKLRDMFVGIVPTQPAPITAPLIPYVL